MGLDDRAHLQRALGFALAKSPTEQARYDECFQLFFDPLSSVEKPLRTLIDEIDEDELEERTRDLAPELQQLVRAVLSGDHVHVAQVVYQAVTEGGIANVQTLRAKRRLVDDVAARLNLGELNGGLPGLGYVKRYLSAQIQRTADTQFKLAAANPPAQLLLESALAGNLAQIPKDYDDAIAGHVAEIAERLKRKRRRKSKRSRPHALDVRQTLRRNIAFDGATLDVRWKHRKQTEGAILFLCDVSGSVGRIARFLLLMLWHLRAELPTARVFAFSNTLGEVTASLKEDAAPLAIERIIQAFGGGTTDYGAAFNQFRSSVGSDLNSRATVIVLGDARSNLYPNKLSVFKEISSRSRRLIWLNPELRETWGTGDSEMLKFAPYCHQVERLSSLSELQRLGRMLVL